MKIKDITEPGFYQTSPFNPEYHEIYEVYNDTVIGLCLDVWIYDYTDSDGRKRYETDGGLYSITNTYYADLEVEKTPEKWIMPELELNAGHLLIEDKLSYKEKLEKIQKICSKASTITQFVGNVEVKDAQKLAIKILKVIE
jgi:hypothetical protein